ncbi:thiol-disulfide isomerase/thioredoxin [Parabacteroides sp. PFB2-12]|uniref:TlpA family protein disulfide reductase n=1 Tax=unclassified Parabacteroides TaxID=2649774 RepID=UPI0024735A0D|nr:MULTISPECIES: TlpA disulfide reductase family protein [unclassified Parabacteroides]MDH6343273.1 thiol-disulfide isomerase/thioredoxin [Parabacteroides sp. PM6-13]MDH6390289.1 thiol-disulfide isomerase/thioredoxin [Parabacteroides sp. PFB2-12]
MKQISFLLLFTACLLFAGCEPNQTVTITGKVTGGNDQKLLIVPPIEGYTANYFSEEITPDAEGNFSFTFTAQEASTASVILYGKGSKMFIVEPGETYHCDIDSSDGFILNIQGKNEEGNRLFTEKKYHDAYYDPLRKALVSRENPLAAEEIIIRVNEQKETELAAFRTMQQEGKTSAAFQRVVERELQGYYAYLSCDILQSYISLNQGKEEAARPYKEALFLTMEANSPTDSELSKSSSWYRYTNMIYGMTMQEEFSREELMEIYNQGLGITHQMEWASLFFTGKTKEYFQAYLLCREGSQSQFNKELIPLFEQFQQNYPQSAFTPYIKPQIDPIVDFYEKIKNPFSPAMKLVENMDHIASLKEAVAPYKGKKIYVDVWATWCGPCKEQFKHNGSLKELLKEKGVEMLYISIDRPEDKTKWENMIKYYGLEGNHILGSETLISDLRKIYNQNGMLAIPWYILFNEKGEIMQLHAKQPSQLEELKTFL